MSGAPVGGSSSTHSNTFLRVHPLTFHPYPLCACSTPTSSSTEEQLSPSQADPSQLVLLPDLSAPVRTWQRQRFLMAVWLCSSIMALLVMSPMATANRWSLVADSSVIAAALGIMGSVLHLRERELASNNSE